MKSPDGNYFNIGRRLTLTLTLLIALILGGNGLVILQFERARLQTDRLIGVSQQLIAVLRLQEGLLSFHQRLNELAESKDADRLVTESKPLRTALLEQTQQTRSTLAYLPFEFQVDPAFLTALDAFETTLPSQLQDIAALATAGDWEAVRFRLDNELKHMETTTSALVKSIDRVLDEELPHAVANMRNVQRRIILIVPATAISTVLIAAFFGWAIARRILELRLEERVRERTRIARELHDTLLQSFQGVLLKFHAVTYMLPDRPEAQQTLEGVIEQARGAIIEGRDALQGLRSSAVTSNDLGLAIGTLGEGLAADQTGRNSSNFLVHVEGSPRDLVPLVWGEVYRIAGEALRNAFRHADARRIEVDIGYDQRQLRVKIRDDGKGIDPKVIDAGGRAGHHGLPGMQERANTVGGKLVVRSELNSGTEVEVTIPASLAYEKSPAARWWMFWERGT
ncbi:MAG: ATP-binding protein [Bryobacteraceae bacterium]|jgi:signal transduction histidine kinase